MSEIPIERIIEIETINDLKRILGNQVVDDMISNPKEWDNRILFYDERYKEIEDKKQKIAQERAAFYNELQRNKISEEEQDRKDREKIAEDKELENHPNFEYWIAVGRLMGIRTDLALSGYTIRTTS